MHADGFFRDTQVSRDDLGSPAFHDPAADIFFLRGELKLGFHISDLNFRGSLKFSQYRYSYFCNVVAAITRSSASFSAQAFADLMFCRNKYRVSICSRITGRMSEPWWPMTNSLCPRCRKDVKTGTSSRSRLMVVDASSTITRHFSVFQTVSQNSSSLSIPATVACSPQLSKKGSNTSEVIL